MDNCSGANTSCQLAEAGAAAVTGSYIWFMLMLISLGTVTGNVLVCLAVLLDKRLQNITNYFLLSMAIADLGVAVFVMPLSILVAFNNGRWPFGILLCNVYLHVDVLLCTSSILHLATISLDRFLAIRHPLRHKMQPGRHGTRTSLKVLAVWLISLAIAFPGFAIRTWSNGRVLSARGECGYFDTSPEFIIYSATGSFFLPLTMMLILYSASIHELYSKDALPGVEDARRHKKSREGSGSSGGGARIVLKSPQRSTSSQVSQARNNKQKKAMKVLGVVFLCFFCCWFPFFVAYCIQGLGGVQLPRWANLVFVWMGFLNSLLNPIIYTLFNKNFREAFVAICRCQVTRLQQRSLPCHMQAAAGAAAALRSNQGSIRIMSSGMRRNSTSMFQPTANTDGGSSAAAARGPPTTAAAADPVAVAKRLHLSV